jgi:hypothetical protein
VPFLREHTLQQSRQPLVVLYDQDVHDALTSMSI